MDLHVDDLPIAMRMKILRTVAGISVPEMALRWGKSPAYVYRVERGESLPTPLEARDVESAAAAVLYAQAAKSGAEPVPGQAGERSELSDEVALAGDARRADRQPRPTRRGSKRRPASGAA